MKRIEDLPIDFGLLEEELKRMEDCLKISKWDEVLIEKFQRKIDKIPNDIISNVCNHILSCKEAKELISDENTKKNVLVNLRRYFDLISKEKSWRKLVLEHAKLGCLHESAGVKSTLIVAFISDFISELLPKLFEVTEKDKILDTTSSLFKLFLFNILAFSRAYSYCKDARTEQAKERIEKVNRIYLMLRKINQLIIRIEDKDTLFWGACRVLVKDGGFKLAWIGILDEVKGIFVPEASYGEVEFLNGFTMTEKDLILGKEPMTVAMREGSLVISYTEGEIPKMWSNRLSKFGFKTEVVCPIKVSNRVIGSLNVYSDKSLKFDQEEIKLLEQIGSDISFALENIERKRDLERALLYDHLTGLPNRTHFLVELGEKLEVTRRRKEVLALLLLDIDNFTSMNDAFGYTGGDSILKEVGARLKQVVKTGFISRVGADEFSIILWDIRSEDEIANFILQLSLSLSKTFFIDGKEVYLTFSFGISLYPKDAKDVSELTKCAELALLSAKSSGFGLFKFYSQDIDRKTKEMIDLETKLRKALERDEFTLFYQPVISLYDRKVIGAESLLRWYESKSGFIPAKDFVPILEASGMIKDVGHLVLENVCKQIKFWESKGFDIKVSCNVSIVELTDNNFTKSILDVVRKSKIDPKHLLLEITETLFMVDPEQNMEKLKRVRDEGIQISIDDFGKGYSSMTYLKKLPASSLKIDISFIKGLPDSREDAEIVKTIIQMAKTLSLKTVAEGVEKKEQLVLLTGLGCDKVQGFYFKKPIPPRSFEDFLKEYRQERFFW